MDLLWQICDQCVCFDQAQRRRAGTVQVLPTKAESQESTSDEDKEMKQMIPTILKSVTLKVTAFDKDSIELVRTDQSL